MDDDLRRLLAYFGVVGALLAAFHQLMRWSGAGAAPQGSRLRASAATLSSQGALALATAAAAQYALGVVVLAHVLPALGLHILDVAAAVAM